MLDRILDFCVLVATDSFITMTSRCDRHMIEGIAHQVAQPHHGDRGQHQAPAKNRPLRTARPSTPMRWCSRKNQRLERMVGDIAVYTGLFQNEPQPKVCSLSEALNEAMEWLTRREG